MLETVIIVLLVLWLLGLFVVPVAIGTTGINLLLAILIIVVVVRLLK